jgi:hypothetical protein
MENEEIAEVASNSQFSILISQLPAAHAARDFSRYQNPLHFEIPDFPKMHTFPTLPTFLKMTCFSQIAQISQIAEFVRKRLNPKRKKDVETPFARLIDLTTC